MRMGAGPSLRATSKDSIIRWILVFAVVPLGIMATLPASIAYGKPAYTCTSGPTGICRCDNEAGCMAMEKQECGGPPTNCQTKDGKTTCQCQKARVKDQSNKAKRMPAPSRSP